eukprot:m.184519 g.184519  ORF g.184519 m.184519 type:complete len:334 (-) comp10002_c0_seq26:84-1085(-)
MTSMSAVLPQRVRALIGAPCEIRLVTNLYRRSRCMNVPQSTGPFEVTYHGFVYVKGSGSVVPGFAKVKEAYKLLRKPKAARKMHPLFARGFDTQLALTLSEEGVVVRIPKDGKSFIVMDHPMHKIAYVVDFGKSVCFIAKHKTNKRANEVLFKCHGFETSSSDSAKKLACAIAATANEVFRKLRRTRAAAIRSGIRLSAVAEDPTPQASPAAAAPAPPSAEAQLWVQDMLEQLESALMKVLEDTKDPSAQKSLMDALKLTPADDEEMPKPPVVSDPEAPPPEEFIWYDDFSEGFVRMSMGLHNNNMDWESYSKRFGEYAEVQLDNDDFNVSDA